jgi:hypothetical protein
MGKMIKTTIKQIITIGPYAHLKHNWKLYGLWGLQLSIYFATIWGSNVGLFGKLRNWNKKLEVFNS